ncbi:cytochrome c [Eoetvoesiella caeni]|uniref:Mono/diheme cytochrome c family protein n=1 Tax=Eoetvoesiella caeni TaxID=645616 RepID=A0A366H019_9BURK|nr:cytochrome c [Eoetvoesiella caeni]MCI2811080.1 cytochrome c [Eoetvoesiella caeni]NYT57008.1 cytochrome c [Eoetvoesiella caeni]RBP35170.1 mono/diheme cytochrome c family protein [Eoetvoesiella caeni]
MTRFHLPDLIRSVSTLVLLGCLSAHAAGPSTSATFQGDPVLTEEQLEPGRYLTRVSNCAGCHTVANGKDFAGGPPIPTPFGTMYGPNITPSREHGIGNWSADDFWNAMHDGKAPDGTLLYPTFPYPQYTRMTRTDTDAIYNYLMSQPAADTPSRPHELRFPYDQRPLLRLWRAMYFDHGALETDPAQDYQWNRGRYLVEGPGHCAACHTERNRWGGSNLRKDLEGGGILGLNWYATPLTGGERGLGNWSTDDIVELLLTGASRHGTATGPMAEVVTESTQHWNAQDLHAVAAYLKTLPASSESTSTPTPAEAVMSIGGKVYQQHCAHCHGDKGEGDAPAWPPLVGNTSVLAHSPTNVLQMILKGGYAPATETSPRPHGMPPFHGLSDTDVAAVATYIRNSWGNDAPPANAHDVARLR